MSEENRYLEDLEQEPKDVEELSDLGDADASLVGKDIDDVREYQTKDKKETHKKRRRWQDVIASLIMAVASVPDGLATALMVGVNPVHGLYAAMIGPTVSGVGQSSQLLFTSTTVAASVVAGRAVAGVPEESRLTALFTLVVLTGVFLCLFGLLNLGRFVKYIPYSVMRGFMYGIGILLVLEQFPNLVGYVTDSSNAVTGLIDTFLNIDGWQGQTILISIITFGTMYILRNTKLEELASIIGLAVSGLVVYLFNFEAVDIVLDVSPIPRGLPSLSIPDFTLLNGGLVVSAIVLAMVIAVQGLGVSQMASQAKEEKVNPSQDMIAQGAANVGAGFFSGIPVGASVGQTALNITSGAQSRLSPILTGIWMFIMILIFPALVEQIPMPALSALIMIAGLGAIDFEDVKSILKGDKLSLIAFVVTMIGVILFSIPVAVTIGVVVSVVLQFFNAANNIRIHRYEVEDKYLIEKDLPDELPDNDIIILEVEGSLFYGGAQTFENLLPEAIDSQNTVVILRLRNQIDIDATLIDVLDRYAQTLEKNDGALFLVGLNETQLNTLYSSGKLAVAENIEFFKQTEKIGEATGRAYLEANRWVEESSTDESR